MTAPTVASYDLTDPAFQADPYPRWSEIRAAGPVGYWADADALIVVGYEEARSVIQSDLFSPSRLFYKHTPPRAEEPSTIIERLEHTGLFHLGPADHLRIRRLISRAFTPASIEALRPQVRKLARDRIAPIAEAGSGDIAADVASLLPLEVIASYLGLDAGAAAWFRDNAAPVFKLTDPFVDDATKAEVETTLVEVEAFLTAEIDARRGKEPVDLLGRLVQVDETGDLLSPGELFALVMALLLAGAETTSNLITLGTLALCEHPDQLDKLVANQDLLPGAIEEMVRWSYIGTGIARFSVQDTTIGDLPVEAGNLVFVSIGAALRDPAYVTDPDRFDITRPAGPSIAFGVGAHYCIGAALARLEAFEVFSALLELCHPFELAGPAVFNGHPLLRGLSSLPVACHPS